MTFSFWVSNHLLAKKIFNSLSRYFAALQKLKDTRSALPYNFLMIWNHGINFLSVPGTQHLISVMNSTSAGYCPGLGSCINYFYCTTIHYREDGQVQPFSTDPCSGLPQDVFEISVTKGLFGFSLIINCFPLCTHRKIHNGWIDWKILHFKKVLG